jgi:hypothetical protein
LLGECRSQEGKADEDDKCKNSHGDFLEAVDMVIRKLHESVLEKVVVFDVALFWRDFAEESGVQLESANS